MALNSAPSPTAASRKLTLTDILDQRAYARERDVMRAAAIAAKRRRRVHVGPVMTVTFENRLTVQNQIQEMLRVERVVTDDGVAEELKAFNPLIPEPGQLCATVFLELTKDEELREWLPKLVGVETSLVVKLSDGSVVRSTVDEQHAEGLTRDTVTAAVHYVRFEFTPEQVEAFAAGDVWFGSDHASYAAMVPIDADTVSELLTDLRPG